MSDWQITVEQLLGTGIAEKIPVGGGDFAQSWQLTLSDGRRVFLKSHRHPPDFFFSTEARGLSWLRAAGCAAVPEVLGVSDAPPFLLLEWIAIGQMNSTTEAQFGRDLAALHNSGHACFGRSDHRATGSLAVPNKPMQDWSVFFASQRLLPLAAIAHDRGSLPGKAISQLEQIAGRLQQYDVPVEGPSMLHGDLWAGNRVVDVSGQSWLIDPAAHGGHREFDLAMMKLFGGFGAECFAAYHEVCALSPGWQQRVALHQLAPLTVHAIKFGGSYVSATQDAIARYC